MQCANHQIPYGTWRLRVFQQVLNPSQAIQPTRRSFSSSTYKNQNEDKTTSSPSQQLPQSPFVTHPRRQTGRKTDIKLDPKLEGPEPLSKNPWAQALASPIRSCALTSARIPRSLMGEWGLVRKPNTEELFILPVNYLKDFLKKAPSTSEAQAPTPNAAPHPVSGSVMKTKSNRNLVYHMTNLISSLRALVEPLGTQRGRRPPVFRLVPFRWKHPQGPVTKREEGHMNWLDDMPQYVLRRMRRDLSTRLVSACQKSNVLGAANGVWSVIGLEEYSHSGLLEGLGRLAPIDGMECGAVILLGLSQNGINQGKDAKFPDSVDLPQIERGVPVFDLSVLLSESELVELRETVPHFQETALFFRPNNKAVMDLMMSLWKLKRYSTEDREMERLMKIKR
ncbi:hypothetical protein N7478_002209 [Penicillium angulare]|uniref:uncharacterized protein n=1 Tax=Penicillium angulare TaxID=116970 RepID=UPI002541BAC8|nr:uncharacterized protein N7478_002209 [Penicillium angulare]KAJ5289179.1 hypothetical protein N7478_002209 [Penicillium angulare]